ncbi:TOPRIM nucleotidyl transferase/hydrolase domain-containing protein [Streptomyces sp. MB09-02B]|uniref:TOPRIM nucleotidyl transferase/hydrolase domain-containing protein n=1 Tax=Streptomyces sp. MB09-02B TaxID=3028667 RepID=UPI0029A894B3|nr:TOPRIM nucleotidyl transferase/hydrolase domain-containing protein [Streptomyces sp. MB09-02B]MDX3640594.1 ATP-dependent endonuclease [Streptomyces sp. MB09-02B]
MVDMRMFRDEVTRWAGGGSGGSAGELAELLGVHTAVLVEGLSDLAAVETLAERRGRDLAAEGVSVLSMGGAMSVGRYASLLGPSGLGLRLVGLCDEREKPFFDRGLAPDSTPRHAVFVCSADLEDELIRALGPERVEQIVHAEDESRPWQTFLQQPAQHGRPRHQQLRRFMSTRKGRKIRYGRLLVEALAPEQVPAPLDDLFARL